MATPSDCVVSWSFSPKASVPVVPMNTVLPGLSRIHCATRSVFSPLPPGMYSIISSAAISGNIPIVDSLARHAESSSKPHRFRNSASTCNDMSRSGLHSPTRGCDGLNSDLLRSKVGDLGFDSQSRLLVSADPLPHLLGLKFKLCLSDSNSSRMAILRSAIICSSRLSRSRRTASSSSCSLAAASSAARRSSVSRRRAFRSSTTFSEGGASSRFLADRTEICAAVPGGGGTAEWNGHPFSTGGRLIWAGDGSACRALRCRGGPGDGTLWTLRRPRTAYRRDLLSDRPPAPAAGDCRGGIHHKKGKGGAGIPAPPLLTPPSFPLLVTSPKKYR
eukprot:Hpha_TRINITY_DN15447_c0_g3::TRINITY_DN15447_c0_g3_i1::g.175378::m.175378